MWQNFTSRRTQRTKTLNRKRWRRPFASSTLEWELAPQHLFLHLNCKLSTFHKGTNKSATRILWAVVSSLQLDCCGVTGTVIDAVKDTCPKQEGLELLITTVTPNTDRPGSLKKMYTLMKGYIQFDPFWIIYFISYFSYFSLLKKNYKYLLYENPLLKGRFFLSFYPVCKISMTETWAIFKYL